jgi:deoxyribodipyrimidine photolyase-related protein
MKCLRLILGDQLDIHHSWFKEQSADILYVMMEIETELKYVTHHIQKVVAFFSAMRWFAKDLRKKGHHIIYLELDDPDNRQDLSSNLKKLIRDHNITRFEYQEPDEWRLEKQLAMLCKQLDIKTARCASEHFMIPRNELSSIFISRPPVMESFYRQSRKRFDILVKNGKPLGEKWNYDQSNREKFRGQVPLSDHKLFDYDRTLILNMIKAKSIQTIGSIEASHFIWPESFQDAMHMLEHFLEHHLPHFGRFQDAMTEESPWLFHSRLSFALNIKLLHPHLVIDKALSHWENNAEKIDLAQIEGFIRQIVGWREYMRGIYWTRMPEYKTVNKLNHKGSLPAWYWSGETGMNCLKHAIKSSLDLAYAHHIHRLMITGNFALLLGVDPDEVDEWYLGIYIDAIEWVELPNTRGMSQYADGGIVATKPYISSANYIDKMSDYCSGCIYREKDKVSQGACPFNSLYWAFLQEHRERLKENPRMKLIYKIWDRFSDDTHHQILNKAQEIKNNADKL